ncbi:hypothetical protein MMC06_001642 [Schaereria dolodes]|nr:hypothetical protein [Schaereria dolodes]
MAHDRGTPAPLPLCSFSSLAIATPQIQAYPKFLQLPAEIRKMVYDLVLTRSSSKIKIVHAHPTKRLNQYPRATPYFLLGVCRLIYGEARHIYYRNNAFHFTAIGDLYFFLKGIGPTNHSLIQSVTLTFGHGGFLGFDDSGRLRRAPTGYSPISAWKMLRGCAQLKYFKIELDYRDVVFPCDGDWRRLEWFEGLKVLEGLRGLEEVSITGYDPRVRWANKRLEEVKSQMADRLRKAWLTPKPNRLGA